jgi:hypothetical protein
MGAHLTHGSGSGYLQRDVAYTRAGAASDVLFAISFASVPRASHLGLSALLGVVVLCRCDFFAAPLSWSPVQCQWPSPSSPQATPCVTWQISAVPDLPKLGVVDKFPGFSPGNLSTKTLWAPGIESPVIGISSGRASHWCRCVVPLRFLCVSVANGRMLQNSSP